MEENLRHWLNIGITYKQLILVIEPTVASSRRSNLPIKFEEPLARTYYGRKLASSVQYLWIHFWLDQSCLQPDDGPISLPVLYGKKEEHSL